MSYFPIPFRNQSSVNALPFEVFEPLRNPTPLPGSVEKTQPGLDVIDV